MHEEKCFITLTYDQQNVPQSASLNKRDWQLFMKKLREKVAPKKIRFFMAGEYGSKGNRPHYHAIIFGHQFDDMVEWKKTKTGAVWISKTLETVWGAGFTSVGTVTAQSAAYVAKYCQKRVSGEAAKKMNPITGLRHYERIDTTTGEITTVEPEFACMSNRPGIGASWLDKWETDALPRDEIRIDGKVRRVPEYFLGRFKARDESLNKGKMFRDVEFKRWLKSEEFKDDRTPERLAVREAVAKASITKREEIF
ncbi:MAG: replication initiator protein [Microvirus sp.]|nr:MAG: replication initiator protein [Microvirus sp.]